MRGCVQDNGVGMKTRRDCGWRRIFGSEIGSYPAVQTGSICCFQMAMYCGSVRVTRSLKFRRGKAAKFNAVLCCCLAENRFGRFGCHFTEQSPFLPRRLVMPTASIVYVPGVL